MQTNNIEMFPQVRTGKMVVGNKTAAGYRCERIDPFDNLSWRRFGVGSQRQTLVYRLFDDSFDLLYVGIAWNPYWRWVTHRRTKHWWPQVTHAMVILYPDELAARRAETRAIKTEAPRYNIHQAVKAGA